MARKLLNPVYKRVEATAGYVADAYTDSLGAFTAELPPLREYSEIDPDAEDVIGPGRKFEPGLGWAPDKGGPPRLQPQPGGAGWWLRGGYRVHPAAGQCMRASEVQSGYVDGADFPGHALRLHVAAPSRPKDVMGFSSVVTDLDARRLANSVFKHRVYQRYRDGQLLGAVKAERVYLGPRQVRDDLHCPPSNLDWHGVPPEPEIAGWCHVYYRSGADAAADLVLAREDRPHCRDGSGCRMVLGGNACPLCVSWVAAGGPAQQSGVTPGYILRAINGHAEAFQDKPAAEIFNSFFGPVSVDLLDPKPRPHGIPSLGDFLARLPLREAVLG